MANVGRFVCVLLPFLLTLASLIAMLIAGLTGVTHSDLYMLRVNTTNLTVSSADVTDLITNALSGRDVPVHFHDSRLIHDPRAAANEEEIATTVAAVASSITAADLGIYDNYDIALWGYCYTAANGSTGCTKPAYNWAKDVLNVTTGNINSLITTTGLNVTLPSEVTDALDAFATALRWTEIVFIVALVALGLQLIVGIFATCSRIGSCAAWLVSLVSTLFVVAAATLSTVVSYIVIGAIEGTAKTYGVTGDVNTRFLATVWIGAAFALAAGIFWVATCCCCKPDHSSRRGTTRAEKHASRGPYAPIGEQPQMTGANAASPYAPAGTYNSSYGQHATSQKYEPYSHANV